MAAAIRIRRREPRHSPMRDLRIGAAARAGAAPRYSFPGFSYPRSDGGSRRLLAGLAAVAVSPAFLRQFPVLPRWRLNIPCRFIYLDCHSRLHNVIIR